MDKSYYLELAEKIFKEHDKRGYRLSPELEAIANKYNAKLTVNMLAELLQEPPFIGEHTPSLQLLNTALSSY